MAIQAQAYQDSLRAFPLGGNHPQEFFVESGNGNGVGVNGGNGCGMMNFSAQQFLQKQLLQQQQQQILMQQQERNQGPYSAGRPIRPISGVDQKGFSRAAPHPQSLRAQIDQQGREIDLYLHLQNERLRLALQEQRQQQIAEMLKRIDSKMQMLMTQKDQEIAQATQKTSELQDFLTRLEMESEAWRRLAEENEAVVVSLNNTLEELRRDRGCSTSGPREVCIEKNDGTNVGEEGTGENRVEWSKAAAVVGACRGCGSGTACVLFLPCRHLCACGPCAAALDACPVCQTAKKYCVEALIS